MITSPSSFDESSGLPGSSWLDASALVPRTGALHAMHDGAAPECGGARHGPRALMLAILEDAIWCLGRLARARRSGRNDAVGLRARAWILQRDSGWIFSFENVCEELGLDAERLRAALLPGVSGGDLDAVVRRRSHSVRPVHVGSRRRRREEVPRVRAA